MKLFGGIKIWTKINKLISSAGKLGKVNNTKKAAETLTRDLKSNINLLLKSFENCDDISCKNFNIGSDKNLNAAIIYIDTLIDINLINSNILEPLMYKVKKQDLDTENHLLDFLKNASLSAVGITKANNTQQIATELLIGKVILLVNKSNIGLMIDCKSFMQRNIEEPLLESVNRGPRDGFTENAKTNISLVRQRLKTPSLKTKKIIIGERTNTDVIMLYIDDIANKDAIDNVYNRLSSIKTDGILESGYIEEYLETNPYSPFPQVDNTERPDKVVACLLEGRIAVIVDGTPVVSIVPSFFIQLFQSPEDYYQRTIFTIPIRINRFLGSFMTTSLPGIYLSLVCYHSQLLPTKFVELLLNGRNQLPLPAAIEVLIMMFMIDLTQEASSRLLGRVGQTMGILGTIVLGQAAVTANIAAPTTIVIIATTTITSYLLTSYPLEFSFKLLRYLITVAAAFLGIYGILMVWLWIIIHLSGLESINSPYLSPIAPLKGTDLKDSFIRIPLRKMFKRPLILKTKDIVKQRNIGGTKK